MIYLTNNKPTTNQYKNDKRVFCEIFKNTVANNSDKIAVVLKDKHMTFKEIDEKSTLVAQCIAGKGFGAEDIIAIKTGRSVDTIVAMIGILKSGAAFLFLDSLYPEERLEYMINDCNCKLIITKEFMDNLNLMIHGQPKISKPENLAVIIYTSGSTGHPKGVMIEQKNITALINSHTELEMNHEDIFGVFPNFSFVAILNDIFTTLAIGGTIDIVPAEIRKDIKALAQYYINNKITITYLPPHMACKYIKIDDGNKTLKTMLVGSESARNLQKRHYKIRNIYASSELCTYVSNYLINEASTSYPIGKIKNSLKYYIIDDIGKEVRNGEIGELCISGPQVSRGYLNNPEKTSMVYIENPFTQEKQFKTLFKTNDLVQQLPDGNLMYISRKDWMFKIRGYRVECSEVELAMLKYPEITEAAVSACADNGGTNILCGYFIANIEINPNEIKTFLKEHLPSYMVPTIITQLDDFPRNYNNKVNKEELPKPNLAF